MIQSNGRNRGVKRAIHNVPASTAAHPVVTAVTGKKIRVLSVKLIVGATATDTTFQSNATPIDCLDSNDAHGGYILPLDAEGWFETVAGEPLTLKTGAGATVGVNVRYSLI